jgi:zinc transport system substrate-binding protein
MKKVNIVLATLLMITLVASVVLSGCSSDNQDRLKVVTSTSLISSIVERIAGDKVDVVNIIPPAQCPGHFDVSPVDIQKLADAALFLMHGWQGEQFSEELIASADNPDLTVVVVNVQGNWMTPTVYQEAIGVIAGALVQVDAGNSSTYEKAASDLKDVVAAKGAEAQARLSGENLADINVLCADQQAGFVTWTGLNVVEIFGRPDTFTPQVTKDLVDKGRQENVTLIIDNLQSGQDAGAGLAEELGCARIILSNFPGGFDDTETWEKALDRNIDLILEAVGN